MKTDKSHSLVEMSYAIFHDLIINSAASQVFDAVSHPNHLINWWPLKCTGTPEMGEIYNFYFAPEYDWYGEVIRIVPDKSFHIKMTKSDPDWDTTSFGFDIEEDRDKVKLCFSHIGWPEQNAHFRTTSYCWAMLLSGLKSYVEKGIILPFEERS